MDAKLAKKLKTAQAAFKKAQAAVADGGGKEGFFRPSAGRLEVQFTGTEVNESQTSGRLQAYLEMTILEGEDKGQKFRKYYGLDEKGFEWFLKDLARLGVEAPSDLGELEDTLQKEIVDKKLRAMLKIVEDGEYDKVYIQKVLGAEEGETSGAEGEPEPEAQGGEELEAPAEFVPEAGSRVTHDEHGAGVVKSIDADDKDAVVKFDDGKKETVAWDSLKAEGEAPAAEEKVAEPEAEAAPEGEEIAVGMRILADGQLGVVTKIDAEKAEVSVKLEKTGKVVKVGADKLAEAPKEPPKPKSLRVSKK